MRDGRARVCIATDVAARGIDLPKLELVIHADLPLDRETLLHRSGRTGRAGRKGVSVLIVPRHARKRAERLLYAASIDAKWDRPPSADDVLQRDKERLLADPILSEPPTDEERAMAETLLARHGAEQVAAAFLRHYRAGQSAPEELQIIAPPERSTENRRPLDFKKKQHTAFGESVWFAVSVGRKQNAEPRWLLPMLCGAGSITKRDIGSIKIQAEESHFELSADAVEGFLAAIGPNRILEKNIRVRRLDEAPAGGGESRGERFASSRKPPSDDRPPSPRPARPKRQAPHAATEQAFAGKGEIRPKHKKTGAHKPHTKNGSLGS
jgi:ATP-dependent RNA helicase DeaD